ncbi:craniofacial development protein 1 isoform X3 [Rhincodon typus]|uniref:craniofacial development protein 1 isoform X3 n=1 Tax=Rhincodon typus TaxID=259920 RepID=UPI00202F548D|nr:craniofacial development protein 1 isoform X3 [Rhincodon typus]
MCCGEAVTGSGSSRYLTWWRGRGSRVHPEAGHREPTTPAGVMSDSESENYSSEEDEDYEPSGDDEDYSEDDVNDLVKEDNLDEDEQPQRNKCLKKAGKRKRNQEELCLQRDDAGGGEADHLTDATVDEDLKEKKKADDLWASFLSDVGHKPKSVVTTPASSKEGILVGKLSKPEDTVKDPEKPKAPGKVTITKVFDFAGEKIKVTKEVDAASKEAKTFLKNQNEVQEKGSPAAPSALETGIPTGSGVKRQSGLGSILGKIGGKKQKLSTLEKSKIDWEAFKEKEGIGDELAIYNRGKEGYIERKAFLDRVDHRQFELERDIRLSNMKP